MGEERLIILRLLEEGKISESEAEELLDALGDMEYDHATQGASDAFNTSKINLSKDGHSSHHDYKKGSDKSKIRTDKDFDEILESLGKKFEHFGEHLGGKMDGFGEEFGKKMINFGTLFADKSISIAEKIIDVVEKTVDSDVFINVDLFGNVKTYEEVIEKNISDMDEVSVHFEAHNGSISINTWDESTIKVVAYISAKEGKYDLGTPILDTREEEGMIYFYPTQTEGVSVKLKVFLPKKTFNLVRAQSKNGSILVEDLTCKKLFLLTKNSSIQLINVDTKEEASCTTTNSKIIIENCKAEDLLAATKNGKIHIEKSSLSRIEGLTSNSRITIRDINYTKLSTMSLKTTNARVEIFGVPPQNVGVQLEGSTTHGNVNIGMPVVYVENIKNYSSARVNARTIPFDTCETTASIRAHTTNSSIQFF